MIVLTHLTHKVRALSLSSFTLKVITYALMLLSFGLICDTAGLFLQNLFPEFWLVIFKDFKCWA